MKTLYIVRHAKSSWKHETLTDFERPLNKRGRADAPLMGEILHTRGADVRIIRSSPANRALTTARLIAEGLDFPVENIETDERMYGAGDQQLLAMVRLFPDTTDEAMLVGHNPGMHFLAERLAGFTEDNLPTGAVVCVDFNVSSWSAVAPGMGSIRYVEYPKKHK
ncbi:MAG: histidine phosphatase family protein [Bacteroidetes bacterium]|nr:histidine phosphatase family protein [Bacteroidota bacterium]